MEWQTDEELGTELHHNQLELLSLMHHLFYLDIHSGDLAYVSEIPQ